MFCSGTSASPAGHGAPKATEHSGGPGIAWGRPWVRSPTPPAHRPVHSHYSVFTATRCVCRVLGGLLQPKCRSRMLTPRPVPERITGGHHIASFSESFYAASPRFFVQKNYGARTHTVRGHSFLLLRPIPTPTENAPLARQLALQP